MAVVDTTLGQLQFGQADYTGAAQSFRDALAIQRRLAAAAPSGQPDVAVLLE